MISGATGKFSYHPLLVMVYQNRNNEKSLELANHIHDTIFAAIGLQYYYATLIVLQIHKPQLPGMSAFESARMTNIGEVRIFSILEHIRP